jgi:hypothetical protein
VEERGMSFLEEAAAESHQPSKRCKMCDALTEMDPAFRLEVLEAFSSPLEASAIARALRKRGIEIGESSVRKHRREAHVVR